MLSIIVAMDEKRGIGKDNKLLWHIPEDLQRFKNLTSGHPVIMGRKTYESIGRHLPNRTNIVVTKNQSYNPHKFTNCQNCDEKVIIVHSLDEALRQAQGKQGLEEIFIIGGGQVFQQALTLASKLYLTIVKGDFGADTFFPDYSEFKKVVSKEEKQSDSYNYTFLVVAK